MQRRALVVGAGIGGLATGRLLHDAGWEVQILERASNLVPQGAGISLWPNASRVLRDLGLAESLPRALAYAPDSGLRRWDGRLLVSTDIGEIERRFGAPMLFLQRTTLHNALLSGGVRDLVRTEAEVIQVSESIGQVSAKLRNGECIEADVLIGADGVGSKVRAGLLDDGPPTPSGLLAYRALTDPPPFEFAAGEYWGPGRVFGGVQLDGNRFYWFATKRGSVDEPPEPDPIPGLLERHRGWAPEIAKVLEVTPPQEVMRHALFDRKPSKRWVGDRVALLGDAAHPMFPFLGQGACQALEDAQALGQVLRPGSDVPAALREYQRRRQRRAAWITTKSRGAGRLAHIRAAPLRAMRDRAISIVPERARMRQIDRIVGSPS
jgi:2-polyprenyl-6-methoxyphenol hydroxylase-like FAD-dependent oxidoreductase